MPKISILVPVYNAGGYLEPSLESLTAQTLSSVEVICVDDGSKDKSGEVLDKWAEKDNRFVIIHQENAGYGVAMNKALAAAKGEYISIIEPDDWAETDMMEHLYNLAKSTAADIAKGTYYRERFGKSDIIDKFDGLSETPAYRPEDVPQYVLNAPSIWTALYRREWLIENGIRFSETPGASFQDLGFCIRTWLKANKIAITHKPVYHYREDNPNSSTRRKEDGAWAILKEFELQSEVFSKTHEESSTIRSILVQRIYESMAPDWRTKIFTTSDAFLTSYAQLLNKYFPLETLNTEYFKKNVLHDLQLLYHTPLLYPKKRKNRVKPLQKIFSYKTEGGLKILRILGNTFILSNQSK